MEIVKGTLEDCRELAEIERQCFPAAQAADEKTFYERLRVYPDHFWLLKDEKGKIISFVNGMCTDIEDLSDEMYADASMHNERGEWQMIFGVDTLPAYRHCGYAYTLLEKCLEESKAAGRTGAVLTCLRNMIPFYERLGFVNEGVSESTHGDAEWYQMRILFKKYLL